MLKIVHLELKEINAIIEKWHRHHKRVQGHRFSIGALEQKTGELVGGCSVGRPVARNLDQHGLLEVTRLVTNGTKNACSFLYSAAARAGRELGYKDIHTYVLASEDGTSLLAAGWELWNEDVGGGQWKHTDGKPRRTDQPTEKKNEWGKHLND